jgi:DNA-binding LacI/PurR family transcriptional regulator
MGHLHGIQRVAQHLATLRQERIGFISGPARLRSARACTEAFEQSMLELGQQVRPEYIVQGEQANTNLGCFLTFPLQGDFSPAHDNLR